MLTHRVEQFLPIFSKRLRWQFSLFVNKGIVRQHGDFEAAFSDHIYGFQHLFVKSRSHSQSDFLESALIVGVVLKCLDFAEFIDDDDADDDGDDDGDGDDDDDDDDDGKDRR